MIPVYAALAGDILVAITKIIAAIWTGSAAMTSEASYFKAFRRSKPRRWHLPLVQPHQSELRQQLPLVQLQELDVRALGLREID